MLSDGTKYKAVVMALRLNADIALLKITYDNSVLFSPATFGASVGVHIGDIVLCAGFMMGWRLA